MKLIFFHYLKILAKKYNLSRCFNILKSIINIIKSIKSLMNVKLDIFFDCYSNKIINFFPLFIFFIRYFPEK